MWRDRQFVLYWSSQSVSLVGSGLTQVAMPLLAALTMQAGPMALGVIEACIWLPFLGLPLLAGVVVDRSRKRPVLICANVVRGGLQILVFMLSITGLITIPLLAAIVLAAGAASVFADVSAQAFLPQLVGRERLIQAQAANTASRSVATLAGPGVAGLLVQAFGPPLAILLDGLSFLAPAGALLAIPRKEAMPARGTRKTVLREIGEGLTFIWRTVPIRLMTLQSLLFYGFWQAAMVPFLFHGVHDLGIDIGWWGLLFGIDGAGALVGSLLAPRIHARFGSGRALLLASSGHLGLLLIPALNSPGWTTIVAWGLGLICSGFALGIMSVIVATTRIELSSDVMLGRVAASVRFLQFAPLPIGAATGGVLAVAVGNHLALWLTVTAVIVTIFVLIPLRDYHGASERDV
ncbi:MFS transporter [Nonomuraea aurantiaca]|uniref:MFS transporter n=1 Tax=Nonomuraea aurantiaca TaxID=2878562 RepID=UPI001CDA551B|nr:MFS transporter [Nonomuraea aurantiaca]MCA2230155.1 MFS transporter [Nonomuraea aurantiaca]